MDCDGRGVAQGGFQIKPGWFFQGDQPFVGAASRCGARHNEPRDPFWIRRARAFENNTGFKKYKSPEGLGISVFNI
jgi:hypothetical protein